MREKIVMSNTNAKGKINVDAEGLFARTQLARMKRRKAPNLPFAKINLSHHERQVQKNNALLVGRIQRITSGKEIIKRIRNR